MKVMRKISVEFNVEAHVVMQIWRFNLKFNLANTGTTQADDLNLEYWHLEYAFAAWKN